MSARPEITARSPLSCLHQACINLAASWCPHPGSQRYSVDFRYPETTRSPEASLPGYFHLPVRAPVAIRPAVISSIPSVISVSSGIIPRPVPVVSRTIVSAVIAWVAVAAVRVGVGAVSPCGQCPGGKTDTDTQTRTPAPSAPSPSAAKSARLSRHRCCRNRGAENEDRQCLFHVHHLR